ncbi:SprT-like family-domain-containing protein [Rhizophagus diaphanus]|nr:SprT-like family-domain-containing protein [Rhizophagus diaphanus] [Rhizophagus sp. MUCL 43196]
MDKDEIFAKKLQEEEEKELEFLQLKRLHEESDSLELALKIQAEDYLRTKENNNADLVDFDPSDPNPDLHKLFLAFNQQYFWGQLSRVEVRWSKKMTLCAGLCEYQSGGYICIRMSEPLLKFRPQSDMIDTLLHEMIHAYLFVTHNIQDRSGHGPEFHKHMHRINAAAGTNITVYHNFHDEVNYYKTHVWKCNGPCQHKPPYYGIVKPDPWFETHQETCGGTFIKVSEPPKKEEEHSEKKGRKGKKSKRKIENEISKDNVILDKWNDGGRDEKDPSKKARSILDYFESSTVKQGSNINIPIQIFDDETEKSRGNITINNKASSFKISTVQCPICGDNSIKADEINEHIDLCIQIE